jgi:hypothetical protein
MNAPLVITACLFAYLISLHFILHPSVSQNFAIVVETFLFSTILANAVDLPILKWLNGAAWLLCLATDFIILYDMRAHNTHMLVCIIAIVTLQAISCYWKRLSLQENLTAVILLEITILDIFALALIAAAQIDIVNAMIAR